jgi:hypothetical protein
LINDEFTVPGTEKVMYPDEGCLGTLSENGVVGRSEVEISAHHCSIYVAYWCFMMIPSKHSRPGWTSSIFKRSPRENQSARVVDRTFELQRHQRFHASTMAFRKLKAKIE